MTMTVLYFEDNPTLNTYITSQLKEQGYQVVSMTTKDDAISWIKSGNPLPDLALLDINENERFDHLSGEQIPEDNEAGFKIAEELTRNNKNLPIVFLTGYGNEIEIKKKCKEYTSIELYTKGEINANQLEESLITELLNKINKVLNSKNEKSPLKNRYEKAYGRKIAIFEKVDDKYYVINLNDIIAIKYRNDKLKVTLESSDKKFESTFIKFLNKELLQFLKLPNNSIIEQINFEKEKWLLKTEMPRKERKYQGQLDNHIVYLKKVNESYFRYKAPPVWFERNETMMRIRNLDKEEQVSEINKLSKIIYGELKKIYDHTICWEEINKDQYLIYVGSIDYPNPVLVFEKTINKYDDWGSLSRLGSDQFLELSTFLNGGHKRFKILNVNLTKFNQQIELLYDLKNSENDQLPYIKLSSDLMINGDEVIAFTNSQIHFKKGDSIGYSKNVVFNNLKELFPTISTTKN